MVNSLDYVRHGIPRWRRRLQSYLYGDKVQEINDGNATGILMGIVGTVGCDIHLNLRT